MSLAKLLGIKLVYKNQFHVYMLLLLLLSRVSRVQLGATAQTAAHQAPPSLEFSRQRVLEWVASAFSGLYTDIKQSKLFIFKLLS